MKKINKLTVLIAVFCALFVFGISESFAQEITLQPNRRENTYKTWNVNGIVDIQIRDAKDRGKALEGSHKIKYKCRKDGDFEYRDVIFRGGHSERLKKICALMEVWIKEKSGGEIKLRASAERNGFTVRKEGNGFYLDLNNVIDPDTKNPFEGKQEVGLSFFPEYKPSSLFRTFAGGMSRDPLRRELLRRAMELGPRNDMKIAIIMEGPNSKTNSTKETDSPDPSDNSRQKKLEQLGKITDNVKNSGQITPEQKKALDKLKAALDKISSRSSDKSDGTAGGNRSKGNKNGTGDKSPGSTATKDKRNARSTLSDRATAADDKAGDTQSKTVKKNQIVLNKNGKGDNSYRVRTVIGNDDEKEYDVTLERVKDPDTGEVVTGVAYFIYRCADEGTIKRAVEVNFNLVGNGVAKAACAILGRPYITFGYLLALSPNAAINGYSLNGSIVAIRGVENPVDGKKIRGNTLLVFRCFGWPGLYVLNIVLQFGTAEERAVCEGDPLALITAIAIVLPTIEQ